MLMRHGKTDLQQSLQHLRNAAASTMLIGCL
jgi:hypothetical protein